MQNNPGPTARPHPAFAPVLAALSGTAAEPSEAECLAFDRAYAAAKSDGTVDRVCGLAALHLQLSHGGAA